MTDRMWLHGLGAHLEVTCTGARTGLLSSAMRQAWSRCLVDGPPEGSRAAAPLEVGLDDEADLALRLMMTTQDITHSLITAQIGNLLMLHAGAVSDVSTGNSLVFVAAGGVGKTTLSIALGRRFGYLTDETVGITESGEILPYPKPLSVRRVDNEGLKDEISPDVLELLAAPAAPHLTRLVLLDRVSTAHTPRVEELDDVDALFALTEQSSSLIALPRPLHRLESIVAGAGPVLRLQYRETHEAERLFHAQ